MKNVVVLSGAGISAESGIRTFRDSDGLWEGHDVMEVATPEAFEKNPQLVHEFYNARRAQLFDVKPNDAHYALAKLENSGQYKVTVITQNVDDLHERAGSENVWHMHGELRRKRCVLCNAVSAHEQDLTEPMTCESCQRGGGLRPDIVWFGEIPYFLDDITSALVTADIFVCIGTSGVVRPAADFVHAANCNGAKSIEINPEKTIISDFFSENLRGAAGEKVSSWVESLLT